MAMLPPASALVSGTLDFHPAMENVAAPGVPSAASHRAVAFDSLDA